MNIQPLNINFFNNQKSFSPRISFGERPLYNIKLKERLENDTFSKTDGTFASLNPDDKNDAELIKKLETLWNPSGYAAVIAEEFLHPHKSKNSSFYIIEKNSPANDTLHKTTCIASATNVDNTDKSAFEIDYIQTSPDISQSDKPQIKGSGELMVYGCVKEAQKYGFQKVSIFSSNNSFYEHLGFNKVAYRWYELPSSQYDAYRWYELPSSQYDEFLEKVEKKYAME